MTNWSIAKIAPYDSTNRRYHITRWKEPLTFPPVPCHPFPRAFPTFALAQTSHSKNANEGITTILLSSFISVVGKAKKGERLRSFTSLFFRLSHDRDKGTQKYGRGSLVGRYRGKFIRR